MLLGLRELVLGGAEGGGGLVGGGAGVGERLLRGVELVLRGRARRRGREDRDQCHRPRKGNGEDATKHKHEHERAARESGDASKGPLRSLGRRATARACPERRRRLRCSDILRRGRARRAMSTSARPEEVGQACACTCRSSRMIVLVVLFAAVSFVASTLLGPKRPTSAKEAPYECGIVPEYEPAERFPVKFYLVAMAFIVLDVEIIFLYPVHHGLPRARRRTA